MICRRKVVDATHKKWSEPRRRQQPGVGMQQPMPSWLRPEQQEDEDIVTRSRTPPALWVPKREGFIRTRPHEESNCSTRGTIKSSTKRRVDGGGRSPTVASSEIPSLRSLVHQLVDFCHGNQREIVSPRDDVSQLRSQLASRPQPPPPTTQPEPQQVPPLPPPIPAVGRGDSRLVCRRVGCSNEVSSSCPVRFCQAHCTSPRCNAHGSPVSNQVRQCRTRGCHSAVPGLVPVVSVLFIHQSSMFSASKAPASVFFAKLFFWYK